MGRIIGIEYTVNVYCMVDIEEGTIVKVEQDPDVSATGNLIDENGHYFEEPGAFEVAVQIAEDNEWPVWERL